MEQSVTETALDKPYLDTSSPANDAAPARVVKTTIKIGRVPRSDCRAPEAKYVRALIARVSFRMGVSIGDVNAKRRMKEVSGVRHICAWELHRRGHSYKGIGRALKLDHKSVMYAVAKIERERDEFPEFAADLENLVR